MGCKIGPKGIANVLETMMLEKINLKKKLWFQTQI
jgi:hypothetical protein